MVGSVGVFHHGRAGGNRSQGKLDRGEGRGGGKRKRGASRGNESVSISASSGTYLNDPHLYHHHEMIGRRRRASKMSSQPQNPITKMAASTSLRGRST